MTIGDVSEANMKREIKGVWMTERQMRAYAAPSKLGLLCIVFSGPAGAIIGALLWHFVINR